MHLTAHNELDSEWCDLSASEICEASMIQESEDDFKKLFPVKGFKIPTTTKIF